MKILNDFRYGKKTRLLALPLLLAAGFVACSDNDSGDIGPTANGVTDIGNSIASGIVYNGEGKAVPNARVVAYYDHWDLSGIQDSVETLSDTEGRFELSVDSSASIMLYASAGDESGLIERNDNQDTEASSSAKETQDIVIGPHRKYSGQIAHRNTGAVRIVGTSAVVELDEDGYFFFDDMPQGHITIAYADSNEGLSLKARIEFTAIGSKETYVLPQMDFAIQDSSWLTVFDAEYYSDTGHDSICIFKPNLEDWTPPQSSADLDSLPNYSPDDADSLQDIADEESANVLVRLSMDGSERVFDNESTLATSVNYVDGISGKGILLKAGQFIDLDSLDICEGDFTISLWTRWNGPNGEHQILVSERAYWSDSTSRFQWHYEVNKGWFTVMKSMPAFPYAVGFGDSSAVPVGEWANLVLVSKDHMVSMYVNGDVLTTQDEDGNEISQYEFIPNDLDRKVPLRIGGNEVDTETWNGVIDEILIEKVARSADWVKDNYKKFAEP